MSYTISGISPKKLQYENEKELQNNIFSNPNTLVEAGDSNLFPIGTEVLLPSGGRIDILCLEEDGSLIAVEVKLRKNNESRREVIAQILDYVSELTSFSYHELDNILGGRLEQKVIEIDKSGRLAKTIDRQLRSGLIKVYIAVDEVNEDLRRIVSFLSKHTDFDVRLIQVDIFDNGATYSTVVERSYKFPSIPRLSQKNTTVVPPKGILDKSATPEPQRNPVFEDAMNYYNSKVDEPYKTCLTHWHYRQVRIPGMLASLHYEFLDKKKWHAIGIEFHIESKKFRELVPIIASFQGTIIKNKSIVFDPEWTTDLGRIYFDIPYTSGNDEIADSMLKLIELTKDKIFTSYVAIKSKM